MRAVVLSCSVSRWYLPKPSACGEHQDPASIVAARPSQSATGLLAGVLSEDLQFAESAWNASSVARTTASDQRLGDNALHRRGPERRLAVV